MPVWFKKHCFNYLSYDIFVCIAGYCTAKSVLDVFLFKIQLTVLPIIIFSVHVFSELHRNLYYLQLTKLCLESYSWTLQWASKGVYTMTGTNYSYLAVNEEQRLSWEHDWCRMCSMCMYGVINLETPLCRTHECIYILI